MLDAVILKTGSYCSTQLVYYSSFGVLHIHLGEVYSLHNVHINHVLINFYQFLTSYNSMTTAENRQDFDKQLIYNINIALHCTLYGHKLQTLKPVKPIRMNC